MCSPMGIMTGAGPGGFIDMFMQKDKPPPQPVSPSMLPVTQPARDTLSPFGAQKKIVMGLGI